MSTSLAKEMRSLRQQSSELFDEVEKNFALVYRSVIEADIDIAKQVIKADDKIDNFDLKIEEQCLKILALHAPLAQDLRYIIAMIKINTLFERIGDLANNIASSVFDINEYGDVLSKNDRSLFQFTLTELFDRVSMMMKLIIKSVKDLDILIVVQAMEHGKYIKKMHSEFCLQVADSLKNYYCQKIITPSHISSHVAYWQVSLQLDRISDKVSNVAKHVLHVIN